MSSVSSRVLGAVVVGGAVVGGVGVAPAAHSAVSCVDTAVTESAAAVLARACARRVESVAARSEMGQVFVNPDGSRTAELSVTPRRVRRADGLWVAADPTLRRNADGTWSAVAATVDIRFSGGGGVPLVALTKGGRSFTMAWLGALPAPVIAGDAATYREVRPGVDLVMRATVDGFTHTLVVKDVRAAADPAVRRIGYRLGGSRVRFTPAVPDGVEVTGDDGAPVLRSGGAAMWDSPAGVSTARAAGEGARVAPASSRLDGDRLVVEPDPAMLAAGRYPLYIDPAWITPGLTRWAYATNNNATNDTTYARVGLSPEDGRIYRSFFEFPTSSGGRSLVGARILSATFSIKLYHTYSCQASPVYLWRTSPITGTPRTGWSPALQRYIDTRSAAADKEPTPCYNPDTPTLSFGNNLTNDVQIAADGGWTTYTLGLAAMASDGSGESTQSRWKKFFPTTASLTVNYNTVPNTPAAAGTSIDPSYPCGVSPVVVNALNGLTLRANLSDPDGDNVRAQWQVSGIPAQYAPPDSGFAAAGPFTTTIPAAAFTDGSSYSWSVRADDGTHTGGYSPACPFIVDNTVPNAPTATSTQLALTTGLIAPTPPPSAVVGLPATVDLTPTAGDHNIAGYLIGVGAATAVQPAVWVPAAPDGSAHAAIVPVASGITANILTIKARNLSGQPGATTTLRFKANTAPATARVAGDATGDGRADVTTIADLGNGTSALWRWDSTSTGTSPPTAPQDITTTYPSTTIRTTTGDFDGDGRTDIAIFRQENTGNVTLTVQRSDSNALLGVNVATLDANWNVARIKAVAANFDNDPAGRDDIAVIYDEGNGTYTPRIFVATGSPGTVSFANPTAWMTPAGLANINILKPVAGDFDGDGRTDLALLKREDTCRTTLWVHYSTGSAFPPGALVWDSGAGNWCWDRSQPVSGDFDNDGRADMAIFYRYDGCTTSAWLFYGTASRSVDPPPSAAWRSDSDRWCGDLVAPVAGDFTGDARTDLAIVYRCCGTNQAKLYTLTSGSGRTLAPPVLHWEGGLGTFTTGSLTIDPAARYQLVGVGSGKCVMVPGGADGTQLVQQSCNIATNATYTVERVGGGFVRLHMVHAPASCVNLRGRSTAYGAAIQQWSCTDNTDIALLFQLNYVSGFAEPVFNVGVYASGLVLDIYGASTGDGVPVQQWGLYGGTNQMFLLRRVS